MTTLPDRPNTALLVVDVQNGVMAESVGAEAVIANIAALVEKARSNGVPVVWVQHSADEELVLGSEEWQIVPQLVPDEQEPLIGKCYGDAFEDTALEQVLAGLGAGSLVVAGAQSDACIRCTLHGALARGYDTLLVSDAHTTGDLRAYGEPGTPGPEAVIAHTNLYWQWTSAPGRTAGTAKTAEVEFSAPRA
jgi:nicotinamidase-related amidase